MYRSSLKKADAIVDEMLERLLGDMPLASGDRISILVNSLGATPLEELYIAYRHASQQLTSRGISIVMPLVGRYATSMEMTGMSLSICKLDDELEMLLEAAVRLPVLAGRRMSAVLTAAVLRAALLHVAGRLDGAADELNARDAAVGDGDLGVTVVRGARGITEALPSAPDDIGALLLQCAQAFTKTSGSTFGTLVATGLMAAGKATRGKSEIPWSDVSSVLADALTAMASRGKAQLGDKTMLDGVEALRRATHGQHDPAAMLSAAVTEVKRALDDLRDKPARQGRARIFAEKTVGSDDPGMIVVQRIVEELARP